MSEVHAGYTHYTGALPLHNFGGGDKAMVAVGTTAIYMGVGVGCVVTQSHSFKVKVKIQIQNSNSDPEFESHSNSKFRILGQTDGWTAP